MKRPRKRYILWVHAENGTYSPTEYDTVEEALISTKYSEDWYITEAINQISYVSTNFTKPLDDDRCRCGHRRVEHGPSQSINYTEGKCSECECEHFVMP